MTHRIILTALLLLLTGCQQSPEQARKELAELGVEFSPSVFHESAENGDVVVVELFLTAGMNPDITDEDDDVLRVHNLHKLCAYTAAKPGYLPACLPR